MPDISTVDALKRSLLTADSIVFNQASSGIYLEKLFERLGVADQTRARWTRYPNGEGVMEHLIHGKGREFGFGASTEIVLYADKGLKLVGPLPAEVQNYTSYVAVRHTGAANTVGAQMLLDYLKKPEVKVAFVKNGID